MEQTQVQRRCSAVGNQRQQQEHRNVVQGLVHGRTLAAIAKMMLRQALVDIPTGADADKGVEYCCFNTSDRRSESRCMLS